MVMRKREYYNLDVIISVGYRVNTKRGIQFRQWANQILKESLKDLGKKWFAFTKMEMTTEGLMRNIK